MSNRNDIHPRRSAGPALRSGFDGNSVNWLVMLKDAIRGSAQIARREGARCAQGAFALVAILIFANLAFAGELDETARFRRGIGISHALEWAQIEPGPERHFVFPPFADPSNALTVEELETLRRTGFDFVRLAVDPGPFLQFQGVRREMLDRILVDRVNLIRSSGLAVVVDLHPSDMHQDYTAQALTADVHAPVLRAYLRFLERTAELLGKLHANDVALELMNEPPVKPAVWQPMLEAAYAAARRGSPRLFLVFDGGDEASAAGLMAMKIGPFVDDPAVTFSFHYYDPYQFTHQGASWNAARFLADVPYPARARPLEDSVSASNTNIEQSKLAQPEKWLAELDASRRLRSYRDSGFDANTIATRFAQVLAWGRSQGLPPARVMLGEFGAIDGARTVERARWFHDVRQQAEANGFGWSVWAYRGGSFGLSTKNLSTQIEPDVSQALGLHFRGQGSDP